MKERIFALDIGTRSVVGLLLEKTTNDYEVIDLVSKEHNERAMVDGQIHDVRSVSETIASVKYILEEKHGPLHKVCVAAAGRALKTKRTSIYQSVSGKPIIDDEDVTHLELSAVQQAQYELAKEEAEMQSTHYYCVGYSVLRYHLDGQELGSLIDQQGEQVTVEVIATFLPKVVVESLIAALHRGALEMEALTLEPIAAINVLIPPSMRRLNVALVDIGAGTSDIAITDSGTVTAYGMVPVAGDEITEAISDHYLLDFPLAEKAKRDISTHQETTITDILGFETTVTYNDLAEAIDPAIEKLSIAIRDEILLLNHKAPKAVMLVGGGSLTPDLPRNLARMLDIPENRVAVRGIDAIQSLKKTENLPTGPAYVTPIGIAISSNQTPVQYISITVNDRTIRLFDIKTLTIGDCLLAAGIEIKKLFGRPGMAKLILLNGNQLTLKGEHGTAPVILKNQQPCSLNDTIQNGDILSVTKGEDGTSPDVTLKDLLGELPHFTITMNGQNHQIQPALHVNGKKQMLTYIVQDRDQVVLETHHTVQSFLQSIGQEWMLEETEPFDITVNTKEHRIAPHRITMLKNKKEVHPESTLQDGDQLTTSKHYPIEAQALLKHLNAPTNNSIEVFFNNRKLTLHKPINILTKNEEPLKASDLIYPGQNLELKETNSLNFIFQDVFRHVDIDLTKGRNFKIYRNEQEATFFEPIHSGDRLELQWLREVKN
ncbi:cell division protein FtsA [Pontibacillus sp. ALD_SL1]|uniref:cell division protein FtsA n=1 Tax=Pontibacillus sp. ALD_SL1 TaxID=2777185 RepID=UPI001A970D06|nr:cell division protein FtsA [Pontibacillus sp. ALD_SL1]QSS99267.1 cell division protein FtsA [Pontibacillus sp. ALD_SL1]